MAGLQGERCLFVGESEFLDATRFLPRNTGASAVNLNVDRGWRVS